MSDTSKRKEKQKCAIERPKLENARGLRGIFFIDPDDEEFKPFAMLCGLRHNLHRETCCAVGKHKDEICLYC